jgi:hypothetical protein
MEWFSIIEVDFTGVDNIGSGFSDNIFLYMHIFHQNTIIKTVHTSNKIKKMNSRVTRVTN